MAKKIKWEFENLGGYELLREGVRVNIFDSHNEMLEYIDEDLGIFCNLTKDELNDLKESFNNDKDVFNHIEKWYIESNSDGGGWGTVECKNIDGLLESFVDWNFSTKENTRDFGL